MTYLEVLQKVQKLYRSCETLDHLKIGRKYTCLLVQKYGEDLRKEGVDRWAYTARCKSLAKHSKFLRELRDEEIVKSTWIPY